MPYRKSVNRRDFEERIADLVVQSGIANRKKSVIGRPARDMVFHCAIFQTSAAKEEYIRVLLETWFQRMRTMCVPSNAPETARLFVVLKELSHSFSRYEALGDEKATLKNIKARKDALEFASNAAVFHPTFEAKHFYDKLTYPSERNLKKLFSRLGIEDFHGTVSRKIKRDVGTLIEGFQSVRTAIAHSKPPNVDYADVKRLTGDAKILVGGIDRVLFSHIYKNGGSKCWPI